MDNRLKILKKEKNAIIIAHNYQPLEIQKVADLIGDSFQLAKAVIDIDTDIVVFCGVKFMAETAKLLNPNLKVLLADSEAGCPMADMVTATSLMKFKKENPDHLIVCYVNSSIEVKALSDVCVTSSNAVKIVQQLPPDQPIMFIPDKNLGHFVGKQTGRQIDLWDGMCPIHHVSFSVQDIHRLRLMFPEHKIIVHPECPPEIVEMADFVGSTRELAEFTDTHDKVIIGTEIGLIRSLEKKYPKKSIQALSEKAICSNMKKTSISDIIDALRYELNETLISPEIAKNALKPIQKMIELSK